MPAMTKKPNGSWTAVVTVGTDKNGKRIQKHLTAKSRNELEHKIRLLEDETPETVRAGDLTVGDAVDRYISRREAEVSPSTIANYKKYRRTAFGDLMPVPISKLTAEMLQSSIDAYAKTHSTKTTVLRWNLVYAAIREAKSNAKFKVRLPSQKRKRLTMPDEEKLIACFRQIEGKGIELPVLLAAVCGLRRGEIAALDLAEDVDYEKGLIRVNKDMVLTDKGFYVVKEPKTDAAHRAVPCPPWVLEKLRSARDNPAYKMYAPNTITTKWHILDRELEIGCSFHGLRHYYASVMSALGVPDQYAMERMGHTTNYMLKRYQEYIKSKEAEVNDSMMDFYEKLDPSRTPSEES